MRQEFGSQLLAELLLRMVRGPSTIPALPFEFVVVGHPYSAQNKTAGYTAWRDRIVSEVIEEVDARTRGRGLVPSTSHLRVLIVWLSAQPHALDHPDVMNIIKPLTDALEGHVINGDRQVYRLEAARIDLNKVGLKLPSAVEAKQDHPEFEKGELLYVRVDEVDAPNGPEWEWWS